MKKILVVSAILISLTAAAQPKIGAPSPEIVLKDIQGNPISLSSLKGKVVLIDFWASWCGPCRKANKHLVKMYPVMKDKGFEIYGISLDDEVSDWKQAIAADKIKWLQVNEKGGWNSPVSNQWKIEQIPTNYLLDKQGKIIARDLEGKDLEKAISQLLAQ